MFYGDRAFGTDPIKMSSIIMELAVSDCLFDYFEIEQKTNLPRVCYYFLLDDGAKTVYYYGGEFNDSEICHRSRYFQFPFLRREDIADVPQEI